MNIPWPLPDFLNHLCSWQLKSCILDSYVFWSLRISITILRSFDTHPQERKEKINCSQQYKIWKPNFNSQGEFALTVRSNYSLKKLSISFKYLIFNNIIEDNDLGTPIFYLFMFSPMVSTSIGLNDSPLRLVTLFTPFHRWKKKWS